MGTIRSVACSSSVLMVLVLSAMLSGQGAKGNAQPRGGIVALTFDDLPAHGPLPAGMSRIEIAKAIIEALKTHDAPPVYGFVNAKAAEQRPADAEVLRMWRAAGHPLGNHTFSHMDLNANTVEAFEQDILAGEPLVRSLMDEEDWHWLRFPYLHEGDSPEKHRTVLAFLAARGYRVAEVTISFDDYAYNEPYARCLSTNNAQGIEWLQQSYLNRAAESLTIGQAVSRSLYGRDIKHIMLLHVGAFQTVMLSRLLDLLHQRAWTLTSLADAASDPAYARVAEGRTTWTGTFLDSQQPPGDASRPRQSSDVFQKLGALCK